MTNIADSADVAPTTASVFYKRLMFCEHKPYHPRSVEGVLAFDAMTKLGLTKQVGVKSFPRFVLTPAGQALLKTARAAAEAAVAACLADMEDMDADD